MFKKRFSFFMLSVILIAVSWDVAPAQAQIKTVKPLYERLGGYDAIAAVVDDFLGRLLQDPKFTRFFSGHSTDSKQQIRQLVVDQLCAATGGPCVYKGRDMKTSHAGLGISEEDWNATVNHLVATLEKLKVPQQEKDEVIGLIASLKKDIVEDKKMTQN